MAITSKVETSTWKSFLISFLFSGIEYILDRIHSRDRIE